MPNDNYTSKDDDINTWFSHPNPIVRYLEGQRRQMTLAAVKMSIKNGQNGLDIGCADGYLAEQLLNSSDVRIAGIELNGELLEKAKKRLNGKKFSGYIADARFIPINKKFDFIYCGCVLSHVANPERIIFEMHRLIKKKGNVIIQIPNDDILLNAKKLVKVLRLQFLFPKIQMGLARDHVQPFNLKKLKHIINNSFVIKRIDSIGPLLFSFYLVVTLEPK